ncbi:MAG: bifunctional folylpolyglutamate synthase/dihydrofolate synthase [Firmicutes bacterium]|nr:bifunctional folylpolyglutamate synthase/dihydrofolate synthase [Bacillota bacterium]
MNANNAIEKIHEFEKFGSILGLERMNMLLELLGNPEKDLKVIHVAGTNGKGSTCRYIYSVLKAGGYKVGLYTSPFLEVFNERIELDGQYISDEDLAAYTDRVLECVKVITERGDQSPTEFEVITALAFLYFKEKGCDFVVLEVGLGGRGDSTNVVEKPLVSVIVSISFDHTDRLGNTIAEIAAEKAGIIKKGCPVVTSCTDEDALKVIKAAAEENQCMYLETRNVPYNISEEILSGYKFDVTIQGTEFKDIEISMSGKHQIDNAKAALAALNIMEINGDIKLSREALYEGFKTAKQIGRFETMSAEGEKPLVIIDGAHNEDGAKALRRAMESFCAGKKILMVTGMLADKDAESILKEFTAITKDFIVTEPVNPRALETSALRAKIEALGGICTEAADNEYACRLARDKFAYYDVVLFAGSLYLIGAIRGILKNML